MIYFTRDLHLGHPGIIAMQNRSFRSIEQGIRRYDVGVDANNFMPISSEQILQFYSLEN